MVLIVYFIFPKHTDAIYIMVNRLGGLNLPRKSVVRLTDRPDMTLDVYRGRKRTMQQQQIYIMIVAGPRSAIGRAPDS